MAEESTSQTEAFDAAGYVKMWRDHGGVVHVARGLKGALTVGIHFPDGFEWPPMSELERYKTGKHHDPSWQQAVIDYLAGGH
jgi:hypothetical protein